MTYQRAPLLSQNKKPIQAVNYQSMLKDLNVQDMDKPDETEIMKHIKENNNSWQNTGKNKDNSIQQQPQPTPQQIQQNQNIQYQQQLPQYQQPPPLPQSQPIQQPPPQPQQNNNFSPSNNNNDLNSFDSLFNSGSLLDGISEADKLKFQNASGSVQAPVYQEMNIQQGPPPQSLN